MKEMCSMGRIDNAARNIFFGYIGNILTTILGFISRTVFIYILGTTYLGINGLYSNILSVLSLADLGMGTAINYSLYRPVAEKDYEKIKSLMYLYKRAYMIIAFIIAMMGLTFAPFLRYFIKNPGNIGINELTIYYLIFLFNTVSTYFVAYKYSLINAEQKGYIQTNIHTITKGIVVIVQIVILVVFKSFLLYLLTDAIIALIQKIYINIYLNKLYPYLLDKEIIKLSKDETTPIKRNIKALIYHKIGDVSGQQTDNILISSFVNVSTVGTISNYTLIITSVTQFIDIIFNSLISSFGNLIATEGIDKQYKLFKIYRFAGFWLYGFASIAFSILLSPFIELWIGSNMIISSIVINLIILDYYFKGHRVVVNNFKIAAGIFDEDKYLAFIRGIANLIISLIMVNKIGLPGIYIGTVLSGLIPSLIRPKIIYDKIFRISAKEYYKDSITYLVILLIPFIILEIIKYYTLESITIFNFIGMVLLVAIIPNVVFIILLRKREEFKYLHNLINEKFMQRNTNKSKEVKKY